MKDGVLYVRRVTYFGRETILPLCERARGFADLLKQKTLTAENVEAIKRLGFRVVAKGEEL